VLKQIVLELDAFVFAQPSRFFNTGNGQHFLDKNLQLILDQTGNCNIQDIAVNVDAKYHDQPSEDYSAEQLNRKANSESFLAEHRIKINKNLPCISSTTDTTLRKVNEVVNRVYALLIIAAKGEGIEQDHLNKLIAAKKINSLSPKENSIFKLSTLDDQSRAYATWRYESLYCLLWALGIFDELKFPNEICDVQTVVGLMFKPSREEFENTVQLRSIPEILDALDMVYRMNWSCVDARIKGQQVAGNINPSIIYERHYALNWLVNYQNQDWDNVQTNT